MKRFTLVIITCSLFIIPACYEQYQKEKIPASANEKYYAIEGNRETISFEINRKASAGEKIIIDVF